MSSSSENQIKVHHEESDPFLLHAQIKQMKIRQKQLKILIQAEKMQEGMTFEKNIDEKLRNLAVENCKKTEVAAVQDVIIPALQLSNTLYKTVIAESKKSATQRKLELPNPTDLDSKKQLCALLEQIAGISSETMDVRKEIKALEDNILKMQLEIHQTSSEKLQLIKKLQEKQEVTQEERNKFEAFKSSGLKEEEEEVIHRLTITNSILQKVIAFSGINWADDDKLKAIVLGAGKSLNSQLLEHEM